MNKDGGKKNERKESKKVNVSCMVGGRKTEIHNFT